MEAQVYECIDLNLLTVTEIPEDCDVLAIMDPQEDLSEGAVNIIIDYINRGGNIIFSSLATDEKWSNIQKILDLYGVKINYGILYEGNANNSYAYENTSIIPYILVPNLGASNKITSDLSKSKLKVIMPWAQSLSINNVEEDGVTVLRSDILTTSEKCYNITDLNSALTSESLKSLDASQYVIGTELTRKTTKLNEEGNEEKTESKLIIYANTTFYADYYQLGSIQLQPITFFGNVNLALNSFAELAEQDNLITIRKSTNVTTFQSTTQEDRVVKFIIFGIPVLIILAGIIVWNFRRRKR